MENLKKQRIKAYLLLESLIALSLFAFISQNVLVSVTQYQKLHQTWLEEKEQFLVAHMALQSHQGHLEINDCKISVRRQSDAIVIFQGKEKLIEVKKKG